MAKSNKKPARAVDTLVSTKDVSQAGDPNPLDHAAIATLAYRRWEDDGRKDGEADSHWFQAEHQAGVPFS